MINIFNPVISKVEGGGKFNIHYGLNPPDDTSMLWVEAESEPISMEMGVEAVVMANSLVTGLYGTRPKGTPQSAVVGQKIYYIAEGTSDFNKPIKVYDVEANTLVTHSASLPVALNGHYVCAVGSIIYIFGGKTGSSAWSTAIYKFDTEQNTIVQLEAVLPIAVFNGGSARIGDKIYLVGGASSSGATDAIIEFDTTTETAVEMSIKLPSAITATYSACAVGNKIYVFFQSDTYVVDIAKGESYALGVNCGADRKCSAVVGSNVYLFGGQTGTGAQSSNTGVIKRFNTQNNTFDTLNGTLTTSSSGTSFSADAVDGDIYLRGGYQYYVYMYKIQPPELENGKGYATLSLTNGVFELASGDTSVKVGVAGVYIGSGENLAEQVKAYLHNGTTWEEI